MKLACDRRDFLDLDWISIYIGRLWISWIRFSIFYIRKIGYRFPWSSVFVWYALHISQVDKSTKRQGNYLFQGYHVHLRYFGDTFNYEGLLKTKYPPILCILISYSMILVWLICILLSPLEVLKYSIVELESTFWADNVDFESWNLNLIFFIGYTMINRTSNIHSNPSNVNLRLESAFPRALHENGVFKKRHLYL